MANTKHLHPQGDAKTVIEELMSSEASPTTKHHVDPAICLISIATRPPTMPHSVANSHFATVTPLSSLPSFAPKQKEVWTTLKCQLRMYKFN